jgi:hypothetical protein
MQSINQKYIKQTNDMLLNAESNLELIATQIGRLPVREQKRYLRLALSYVDLVSRMQLNVVTMRDAIVLCKEIMEVVNLYYEENE